MPKKTLTVAAGGTAPLRERHLAMLVQDKLGLQGPDADGYYELPDRYDRIDVVIAASGPNLSDTTRALFDFFAMIDGNRITVITDDDEGDIAAELERHADELIIAKDPAQSALDHLQEAEGTSITWLAWGENADPTTVRLRDLSWDAGLKVKDLCQGMFTLEPEEQVDAPEQPEEERQEKPAPRKRAARTPREELTSSREELTSQTGKSLPAPEKEQEEPQVNAPSPPSSLEEDVAAAHRATEPQQLTIATGEIRVSAAALQELASILDRAAFYMRAVDAQNAAKNLAETKYSPLTEALNNAVTTLNLALYPELDYSKTLKAADKPKDQGKGVRVVYDEGEQNWKRAGRGRVRAGTRTGVQYEDGRVVEDAPAAA